MRIQCPNCGHISAFPKELPPKEKHYWDYKFKTWKKVKDKERKPECSFCGYKWKKDEYPQAPTVSLEEERKKLAKKSNKNSYYKKAKVRK